MPSGSIGSRGSFLVWAVVTLALGAALWALWLYLRVPETGPGPSPTPVTTHPHPSLGGEAADKLLQALHEELGRRDLLKLSLRGAETLPVTVQGKTLSSVREFYRMPQTPSLSNLGEALSKVAQDAGGRLLSGPATFQDKDGNTLYTLSFGFDGTWTPVELDWVKSPAPRICLIIDDGGYQKGAALRSLYAIHAPLTVAIIPDVEFSHALAQEFPDHGVEVMCHMPMEGHEKGAVGGNYKALLKKGMDPALAAKEVVEAVQGLPHCRGLNNHMGSMATEDLELMKGVCSALKSEGLFVIDSRTTAKSQVAPAARAAGVPLASRNVFLDNVETPAAIHRQLDQAAAYAKKHGLAVAIGHFKVKTLQTLEEFIPPLQEKGFQFVYASEVVKE